MDSEFSREGYFEKVVDEICAVFSRGPKPSVQQLFLTADYAAASEYGMIEKFLRPFHSWRDIRRQDLRTYPGDETAILSFLSPFAFRYYLPAFLTSALECVFDDRQFVLAVNLCLQLPVARRDGDLDLVCARLQKFQMLTGEEKAVVTKYLEAIRSAELDDEMAAQTALRSYWQRTAPP